MIVVGSLLDSPKIGANAEALHSSSTLGVSYLLLDVSLPGPLSV